LIVAALFALGHAAAAPILGAVGVGAWNTQVEFADVKVVRGTETLYQSNFAAGAAGWTMLGGTWAVVNGNLRQTSTATPALALVGSPTWSDYTLTLKARKISGAEGFLVVVGSPGDATKTWWNIGGWGNTQHALEMPAVWAPPVAGSVQTGRWYDIRIELQGTNIRCYLDNVVVHDTARVLDATERSRRYLQLIGSPGFALLNADEQQRLRDLRDRSVYIGVAARAALGAMPGSGTFAALSAAEQAAVIRKVNRNRLTWNTGWGFGSDPARDQGIIDGMDSAVMHYNSLGLFEKHLTANNSPGTPTADANYDGQIRFGGSYGFRVALHEISHTLGVGTWWRWGELMVNGAWTGQYANEQLSQFDGPGSVLHGDGAHFWPYGLNYDSESNTESNRRHVLMVDALRRDMGIRTVEFEHSTSVANGLYRISPRHAPGSSLEVVNGNPANGVQLDIRRYAGADSQKFFLDLQTDGTYRIRTALPGNRCVELPNGVTDNGTRPRLWDDNGSAAQRWYLIPVGGGWYKISPRNSLARGLDVENVSTADGAPICIWDYWDGQGQQWYLTLLAPGYRLQDLTAALSIAGGLSSASPSGAARLNVEAPATSGVDVFDALRLARKVFGLETNP
jgi:hypothetical protein